MATIQITGPFTREEIAEITATIQRIEQRRPDEHFAVHIQTDDDVSAQDFIQRIMPPLQTGYERRVTYVERNP